MNFHKVNMPVYQQPDQDTEHFYQPQEPPFLSPSWYYLPSKVITILTSNTIH